MSPRSHRHKFDGTLTNSSVYPLTRALYGKRIRQPIGGDFGFSGKQAGFYQTQDVRESEVARFGIDFWMSTTALANDCKLAQSFLGAPLHDAREPGAALLHFIHRAYSFAAGHWYVPFVCWLLISR